MGVYFIQAGRNGLVKIGWCKDIYPEKRMSVLQIGCPETLEIVYSIHPCSRTFEGFLHKEFRKDRVRGEWFTYSQEIKEFIRWHSNLQRDAAILGKRRKEAEEERRREQEEDRNYEEHMEKEYEKYMEEQEEIEYQKYMARQAEGENAEEDC